MFKFQILIFAAVLMYIHAGDDASPKVHHIGGVRSLEGEGLKEAEKNLQTLLTTLAAGDGPHYTVSKIYSATVQFVSGPLNKYEVDLKNDKGEEKKCHVSILSRTYLEYNTEVTFECDGQEKLVKNIQLKVVQIQMK